MQTSTQATVARLPEYPPECLPGSQTQINPKGPALPCSTRQSCLRLPTDYMRPLPSMCSRVLHITVRQIKFMSAAADVCRDPCSIHLGLAFVSAFPCFLAMLFPANSAWQLRSRGNPANCPALRNTVELGL